MAAEELFEGTPAEGLPSDHEVIDSQILIAELRARRLSRNQIIDDLMTAGLTLDEATDAFDEDIPVRLARFDDRIQRLDPLPPEQPVVGIGGWLLLPMLGLVVRPLVCLRELVACQELLGETGPLAAGPPGLRRLVIVAIGLLLTVFLLDVITAWFFFREKRATVKLIVALHVVEFFAAGFLYLTASSVLTLSEHVPAVVIGSGIGAAVWITYFLTSTRVRNTFVR